MGNCAGKPKTVDGLKPEAADQATGDAKATIVNSNNGETTDKDKIDGTTTNENGDNNGEKKESINQEDESNKEQTPGSNGLKDEALVETEKVAEAIEEVEVKDSST